MKKVILGIFILICLGWIVFFSLETLGVSNSFDPTELFGEKDEQVIIINRQSEIPPGSLEELSGIPCEELYNDLNDSSFHQCFISINQPHMLLLNRSGWDVIKVDRLFKTFEIKNLIESQGTFEVGNYQGRYFKQGLYLTKKGFVITESNNWEPLHDKKASASVVKLNSRTAVTDIYLKGVNRFDYITKADSLLNSVQVDDEELFSRFISNEILSYHFYERDYFAALDSTYLNGPMYEWLNQGFVIVETRAGRSIICDYVAGQDPILNLREKEQNDTSNVFSTRLTSSFPEENSNYQIDYLEDLVVISEKRIVIDQLLADAKLGKTISNNEILRNRLYENLPHLVSERFANPKKAYSRAVYNGNILVAKTNQARIDNSIVQKQSYSMNVAAGIIDFETLPGEGNVICSDNTNNISLFLNGIKEWSKSLNAEVEYIQPLDIYANGEPIICAQTYNKLFVLNQKGKNIGRFPIELENEITSKITFYRWKGSGYFVFGTNDGKAHVYDMQGREIRVMKIGINATRQIDAWASQGRLFYGFANASSFYMYDSDNRKMHRNFKLDQTCISGRIPNEIYQYFLTENTLFRYDQKGTKIALTNIPNGTILKIFDENKNPILVVKSANEIKLINSQGIEIGSVIIPFNEVSDVDIAFTDNGKSLISIIDGLENNVYLYRVGGDALLTKPIEGQQKVILETFGANKKITTIVDQFIIQYIEN